MQLIFCQLAAVADGSLHTHRPGLRRGPLAINTSVSVSLHVLMPPQRVNSTLLCAATGSSHPSLDAYLSYRATKLLVPALACPVLY